MKIPELAFTATNWDEVPAIRHEGESGHALWKTLNIGNIRVRVVEYTPGYTPTTGAIAATSSMCLREN